MLPEFTFDYIPLPEHGREDKMVIEFGTWTVQAHEENLHLFKEYLAPPRDTSSEDVPGTTGWIFIVPNPESPVTKEMKIRKPGGRLNTNNPPVAPYPLFTGKLRIKQLQYSEAGSSLYRLRVLLNLNGQRFARHQSSLRPEGFASPNHTAVCRGVTPDMIAGEFPLDENRDNWIPIAGRAYGRMLEPGRWPGILQYYLQQTEDSLDSEFIRAASISDGVVSQQRQYSIRKVEVAFDCRHENPLGLLHSLESTLRRLYRRFYQREYPAPAGLPNNDLNCPMWTIQIRVGVYFKFYAKTNQRLRLEISHDFEQRGLAHTFISLSALLTFLNERRLESVNFLTEVLERLRTLNPPRVNPCPPFAFLTAWFSALSEDNISLGEHLLRILMYQDCLHLANNDPARAAVAQLRARGLLIFVGGSRNGAYHVALPHRSALEWLKKSALQDGIRQARSNFTTRTLRGI